MKTDLAAIAKLLGWAAVLGLALVLTGSLMGQIRQPVDKLLRR